MLAARAIGLLALLAAACHGKPRPDVGDDIGTAVGMGMPMVMSGVDMLAQSVPMGGNPGDGNA